MDGRFRFTELPDGNYTVTATKPQFLQDQPDHASVMLGPSREDFQVTMSPLGVIEGTATDLDGNPLPGIVIRAMTSSVVSGRRKVEEIRSDVTNDRGAYRIWSLEPGKYYLKAAGRSGRTFNFIGEHAPPAEIREGYADVYYGGAQPLSSATGIQLGPGQKARADFSLAPQPMFTIRGRLSGFTPDESADFELLRDGSPDPIAVRAAYNQSSGRFEIHDVLSGSYSIRVKQGEEPNALYGNADIRVSGEDLEHVELNSRLVWRSAQRAISARRRCEGVGGCSSS
jgi:hypothetical protein